MRIVQPPVRPSIEKAVDSINPSHETNTRSTNPVDSNQNGFETSKTVPVNLDGGQATGSTNASFDISVKFKISVFGNGLVPQAPAKPTSSSPTSSSPSTSSPSSPSPSATSSTSAPQASSTSGSPGKKIFLFGNKKRGRKLKDYLKAAMKAGLKIDMSKFSKADLNRKVGKGQTIAVTAEGEVLGMLKTSAVMAKSDLGVSGHGNGGSSVGHGGSISVNGQEHAVDSTLLKSPVALDLNQDGRIGTTGASTAKSRRDMSVDRTVAFDVDGDGKLDQTQWMAGDGDALLVDDRDGGASRAVGTKNGIDGKRLFGDQGGKFANGYDKLALADADGDGLLRGAELEGIKAWIDDGDAQLEDGELKTLRELGVSEINTRMFEQKNEQGDTLMRSDFVRNGQRQMTEDVWFASRA